ncbi:MAG: hypothetical protein KZQ60_14615 [Candidatus Thiodiazotropha sp. (ex Lucinoma aequizonata)]|nr:hypothetical protein [Candidatus Thiodiazotropha sp. (ex Lucinoma aequizonata)]MCU7911668.1 hypothetical protein [Candidatus Thiodiazotropha sp. (ex Lucinoma aequizonata)]
MHEQLAVEVQYGIMTYAGRSGHNRLSKIESILVDWNVPKSFARSKTRLYMKKVSYITHFGCQRHGCQCH